MDQKLQPLDPRDLDYLAACAGMVVQLLWGGCWCSGGAGLAWAGVELAARREGVDSIAGHLNGCWLYRTGSLMVLLGEGGMHYAPCCKGCVQLCLAERGALRI